MAKLHKDPSSEKFVDRHITSTDKLKAPAEHFKVPTIYWLPKLKNLQALFTFPKLLQ